MKDVKLADSGERVVRHGHGPERLVQTGIGPVPIRRAKVRDRGADDIVLMDASMPIMDGMQAAAAIRRLPSPQGDIPILAFSASTMPEKIEGYLRAGMNGFIAKPVAKAELLKAVHSHLRHREEA